MFEPCHNILSNVRADIRKYVVSWLKRSHESDRPVPGPTCTRPIPDDRSGPIRLKNMLKISDSSWRTKTTSITNISLDKKQISRFLYVTMWNLKRRFCLDDTETQSIIWAYCSFWLFSKTKKMADETGKLMHQAFGASTQNLKCENQPHANPTSAGAMNPLSQMTTPFHDMNQFGMK